MREQTTTARVDTDGRIYLQKPIRRELGIMDQEVDAEVTVRVRDEDDR